MLNESCSWWQAIRNLNRIAASFWMTFVALIAATTFHVRAAQSAALAWDANNDSETAGYFLYSADVAGNPLSRA